MLEATCLQLGEQDLPCSAMLPRTAKHVLDLCLPSQGTWSEHITTAVLLTDTKDMEKRIMIKQNDCIIHLNEENGICCYYRAVFFLFYNVISQSPYPAVLQGHYCGIIRVPEFSNFSKVSLNALENYRVQFRRR